jgi:uncharacterized protein YcbX
MNRFRPNVVVDGIDAYEEDYVDTYPRRRAAAQASEAMPALPDALH